MGSDAKKLPLGLSDFKTVIDEGYTYIDKSLFIQELVEKGVTAALLPRPRRFGKTLNLSMLRYFFEKSDEDTSYLFKSLKIWQNESCRALQGQFPVIFISFKDVKQTSWAHAFEFLRGVIAGEFNRHRIVFESETLSLEEKELYHKILTEKASSTLLERSLSLLTEWLCRYYGKKVILLIDEYDTPAHTAYVGKFYDELMAFLRTWLSAGLKDNPFLEQGVLTGILRIVKESIFSGLNNVMTFTILQDDFQDKFGLTELEVKQLLKDYHLLDKWDLIKQWYNGYRIGAQEGIFNPWSVLSCIASKGALAPYWVNTSDNALMRQLITQGSEEFKTDVEELLRGASIEKTVEEGLIFTDLHKKTKTVWSLLLFSGYLSLVTTPKYGTPCSLRIPNAEVREIYESVIKGWFEDTLSERQYGLLLQSLTSGDRSTFSQLFQKFLLSSFSFFDFSAEEPGRIYHSFVLGMLLGLKDRYEVKSNRESGYGRYDVMLIPKKPQELGIVFEFKKAEDKIDLDSVAISALQQIEERQYDLELKERGVRRILSLGMAFQGKSVAISSKFIT